MEKLKEMRRIIYLGYYLKNLNRLKFRKFIHYVSLQNKINKSKLLFDIITSSLKYNISFLEYFQFRFYELDNFKRSTWAGTGYMYEYQRIMNSTKTREILNDKTLFYREYTQLIKHRVFDTYDLQKDSRNLDTILANHSGKLVFKVADGKCGANVMIRKSEDFNKNNILTFMKKEGFDLVEEFIIQHSDFMRLSPTAVNTIRIFTQLDAHDEVQIIGCRLRISVNSPVDNMAAGNLAAPVDEFTGIVTGPAVYSDITKPDEFVHPVTGVSIVGFQIPYWDETIILAKAAALLHPQNRSIGWDIAMTENGPDLIEGNHDWCKLVWQLPLKKGMKPELEKYLIEFNRNHQI